MRTITVSAAHPALPRSVPAGPLAIRLVATAGTPWGIGVVRLKPGVSLAQAQAAGGDVNKLRRYVTFIGGEIVPAQQVGTVILNAGVPGQYAMHISGREGDPGRVLPFAVTPPAVSVAAPVRPDVTVGLTRHGFIGLPGSLHAGLTTIQVTNRAPGLRNMQIWRLGRGKNAQDFITAFRNARGLGVPSWLQVAGGMDILSSRQTAWMTLRLSPGRYVAECPLSDPRSGRPFVLEGMLATFTVS
jgi:hypothetical protein